MYRSGCVTAVVMPSIHSFIHYGDLYSTSSRLLLRCAPDPYTAKRTVFMLRVECVSMCQSLCQQKSIPHGRANHRECTNLPCGNTIMFTDLLFIHSGDFYSASSRTTTQSTYY